jgi:hypothetical protein
MKFSKEQIQEETALWFKDAILDQEFCFILYFSQLLENIFN